MTVVVSPFVVVRGGGWLSIALGLAKGGLKSDKKMVKASRRVLALVQNLVESRSPIVLALVQNLRLRRFEQLNGVQKR